MPTLDLNQLHLLIEPQIRRARLRLVDLEWRREAGGAVLRLFIDRPGRTGVGPEAKDGVTLDDCAAVSHQVSAVLDVGDVIPGAYSLEVSSPGVNRPLVKERDFQRFVGQKAKIRTRRPVAAAGAEATVEATRRNFSGRLLAVEAGRIRIDVGDQQFEVPVADVEKAHLVYEF